MKYTLSWWFYCCGWYLQDPFYIFPNPGGLVVITYACLHPKYEADVEGQSANRLMPWHQSLGLRSMWCKPLIVSPQPLFLCRWSPSASSPPPVFHTFLFSSLLTYSSLSLTIFTFTSSSQPPSHPPAGVKRPSVLNEKMNCLCNVVVCLLCVSDAPCTSLLVLNGAINTACIYVDVCVDWIDRDILVSRPFTWWNDQAQSRLFWWLLNIFIGCV